MTTVEILKEMNGCECNSLTFEGCVGIINGEIFMDGEKIRYTKKQIKQLWQEYLEEEGIGGHYEY